MGDDRPSRYIEPNPGTHGRGEFQTVYRASAIGGCARSLTAHGMEMKPAPWPDFILAAFARGHRHEDAITARVDESFPETDDRRDLTHYVGGSQDEVELLVGKSPDGPIIVRGHIDGRAEIDGREYVVEAKCFGDSLWAKYKSKGIDAFPMYRWQTSFYAHALNRPVLFVVGHWAVDDDGVEYIKEVAGEIIEAPAFTMRDFKVRVAKLEAQIRDRELPACDYRQYPCPFYYLHDEGDIEPPHRPDGGEIAAMVAEYARQSEVEQQAKRAKKQAGDKIAGWLAAVGLAEADGKKIIVEAGDAEYSIGQVVAWVPERVSKGFELNYPYVKKLSKKASKVRG